MIQHLQWDVCTCLDCNSLTGMKRGGLCGGSKERVRIRLCGTGQPTAIGLYSVSPISAQPCCCQLATACIWDCLYSAQSQHVSQLLADGTDHPCFVCVCVCWTVLITRGSVCLCCESEVSDVHCPLWLEESNMHTHRHTHTSDTWMYSLPPPPPPTSPPHTLVTDR